ncbi:hypothetical protein [Nonomuraea endophytica]|uniref:Uncharacterized protein n=1 Tax=Nonomuraea endophytica TaxID=714136 RepID=A0A7W8EHW5_9ACTN|nr:hypothetical protein [Nonomuraea endophytica]MBB5081400.1 hypothetical protein [Nonomuraea endophytica]
MRRVPPPSSPQPQPGTQLDLRRPEQDPVLGDSADPGSSGRPGTELPDRVLQIDFVVDPAKGPRLSGVTALAKLGEEFARELDEEGLEIAGPKRFEICYFHGSGPHRVACPPQDATHGTALVRVRTRPQQSITAQPALKSAASPLRSPAPEPHLDLALRALASRIIGVPLIVDEGEP